MKTYVEADVYIQAFWISAIFGSELHAPTASTLGKGPRYPLDRRLGVPQNSPRRYGEVKNLWSYQGSNSVPSVALPMASGFTALYR
jgi:hypothetical protein